MPLDAESLAQLRDVFAATLTAPAVTRQILTRWEAAVYTKHVSPTAPVDSIELTAFYRWCSRHRVTSVSPGRYAIVHLDRGLAGEARRTRLARSAPPRPHAKAA